MKCKLCDKNECKQMKDLCMSCAAKVSDDYQLIINTHDEMMRHFLKIVDMDPKPALICVCEEENTPIRPYDYYTMPDEKNKMILCVVGMCMVCGGHKEMEIKTVDAELDFFIKDSEYRIIAYNEIKETVLKHKEEHDIYA